MLKSGTKGRAMTLRCEIFRHTDFLKGETMQHRFTHLKA